MADFSTDTRSRVYDSVIIASGVIAPLAAIWGVTIDQQLVAAGAPIAGSVIGALASILARRNVGSAGKHRAAG